MEAQKRRDWLEVYGDEYRERGLYIVEAHYKRETETVHVKLRAGMTISFGKARAQALANATDAQLEEIEVSPAGWSIDFPLIDDGITLEGLLAGRFGNDRWEQEWSAKQLDMQAA